MHWPRLRPTSSAAMQKLTGPSLRNKGHCTKMPRSRFKDYVLTSELTRHQREGIKQSVNCSDKKKNNKTGRTAKSALLYCCCCCCKSTKACTWRSDTEKQPAGPMWRTTDERESSPKNAFQTFMLSRLMIDVRPVESLGYTEETDPIHALEQGFKFQPEDTASGAQHT